MKGKPCDTIHDHFRAVGNDAFTWMSILTGSNQGAIKFNLDIQKVAVINKTTLKRMFPKLPTGLKLIESPCVNFTSITEDDIDDCEDIHQGIQLLLRAEISDALVHLDPPPQPIPATPTSQPILVHIEIDGGSIMGLVQK